MTDQQQVQAVKVHTAKTQQQLFSELAAARHVADLGRLAVENKMREIAAELGKTFKNEGFCPEHPDAPILQIRVRMNKEVGRGVPYIVALAKEPKESVGKEARARRAAKLPAAELSTETAKQPGSDAFLITEGQGDCETYVVGDSEMFERARALLPQGSEDADESAEVLGSNVTDDDSGILG